MFADPAVSRTTLERDGEIAVSGVRIAWHLAPG
jgi:hypothetical protein